MNRVLVTGASGFIGQQVLAPLARMGFDVYAASRSSVCSALTGVKLTGVDLRDPDSGPALIEAVRPTHLLHLAWLTKPGELYHAPENELWKTATIELFEAFARSGGRRCVFAGTCAEYDWHYEVLHETETPSRPATAYGRAKNATRETVQSAADQAGVSCAWARIFFTYGPREPLGRLVSDVASALEAGKVVKTTAGRQERDYLHVADVAEALVVLLESNVTGTINIASGESVPIRRVVEILGTLSGRTDLLAIGERTPAAGEPKRLVADVTRLQTELQFVPRYGLQEGLEATLAWWRDREHGTVKRISRQWQ